MMENTAGPNITRDSMALYRSQRYQQSLKENKNFYFLCQPVLFSFNAG